MNNPHSKTNQPPASLDELAASLQLLTQRKTTYNLALQYLQAIHRMPGHKIQRISNKIQAACAFIASEQ